MDTGSTGAGAGLPGAAGRPSGAREDAAPGASADAVPQRRAGGAREDAAPGARAGEPPGARAGAAPGVRTVVNPRIDDRQRAAKRGSTALTALLEAHSIALVGASERPGSLGERMVAEVAASPSRPRLYPVNPRYDRIAGLPCHPRLADLPEPVNLVLLGVPDAALEEQLAAAAGRGDRSAVIFGSAYDVPGQPPGLRARLAGIARSAGMALCGAGCMGFVNVARGLRAVGYIEPHPIPAGPVALVTHSGSVFSTLLRSRRGIGFSVAVSSGQELVSTAADYARYALGLPETRVLALVLEAIRDAPLLRAVLAEADAADVPVVLLAAGGSVAGQALVSAHSGALAAGDGAWEALADAYRVHRTGDLAELADTLELFAIGRRGGAGPGTAGVSGSGSAGVSGSGSAGVSGSGSAGLPGPGTAGLPGSGSAGVSGSGSAGSARRGIATIHDSGLERAHVADLADQLGVPFADIGPATRDRLAAVLDPGLEPANPLDIWGTGRGAEQQFTESLIAMSEDPAVAAVALAVNLVPEFDGDESYLLALLSAAARTRRPLAVLAGLPASVNRVAAARLRAAGVPVLESVRTGLLALRHLLDHQNRTLRSAPAPAAGAGRVSGPAFSRAAGADRVSGPASSRAAGAGRVSGRRLLGPLVPAGCPGRRPPRPLVPGGCRARRAMLTGAGAGPVPSPPGGSAEPRCRSCCATMAYRRRASGRLPAARRCCRPPSRSGIRSSSRPTSPACRTSLTSAGYCLGWPGRLRSSRATGIWPPGSVRGCSSARPPRRVPRC